MAEATAVKRASFAAEDMAEGGGSLWDNVRAVLTSGKFTKEAPDNYAAQGNPIFGVAQFELRDQTQQEGESAEEFQARCHPSQSYSLGAQAGDHFTISENGDYLIPNDDDARLVKTSKFGTLMLATQQLDKSLVAYVRDFSWSRIAGLDAQWKRIVDKNIVDSGNDGDQVARRGSQKKKYPPSTLCPVKLYALPGQKGAATQTSGNVSVASSPNPGTAAPAPVAQTTSAAIQDADVWPYLAQVLQDAKGHTEQRGRLTLAVSKAALADPNRAAIARRAAEESFIAEMANAGLVTYASSEKGQPVTLVQ
jgi:hypothetical protein